MQKLKRKGDKNARINEKRERSEKLRSSIKRTKVCLYQQKSLQFRNGQSNTRHILNFRAKEITHYGPVKTK